MEKRLTRNMQGKMIAGVAAGLADYLGIDATVMRLLFVLATFFHGSGLLVYIILWAVMPQRRDSSLSGAAVPPAGVPGDPARSPESPAGSPDNRSAAVIGWILVALGVFFLMDEFLYPWFRDLFYWFNIRRVWPIIFVIVGILIISSANKKKTGKAPEVPPPPPVDDTGSQHQEGSEFPQDPADPEGPERPGGPEYPERPRS